MKRSALNRTVAALAAAVVVIWGSAILARQSERKGYGITESGLVPRFPSGYDCSPLTSLYASWTDVDHSKRTERHSGIDGGRLGDPILAPGPGTVRAAWKADWGWGSEGALLIRHTSEELGVTEGPKYYYSEFDHLSYGDVLEFKEGQTIARGQRLARVGRPGGNRQYLPEVHWEVWEVEDDEALMWSTNKHGGQYWTNDSARLIDPLYMLALNSPPAVDGSFVITPFVKSTDYRGFRGFTYIFPCRKNK
jgi:murein DD-endopeptidase MepM/ murein hydrolase activator NlpD